MTFPCPDVLQRWDAMLLDASGHSTKDEVLPRAMTCGNMLQLPTYSSKDGEQCVTGKGTEGD